jgi:nicotinamidase-related amidase
MYGPSNPYKPLTRDNAALLLFDHQIGLISGVTDFDPLTLTHNVVGLAKAAKILGLPIVAASTARDTMWGPTAPELAEVVGGQDNVIDRSSVNAWAHPRVHAAITATGRRKVIIAAIATEVCATFSAISAVSEGYDAYVAVDASGSFSQTRRDTALLRMTQAGVIPIDFASTMVEVLADNASPLAEDVYAAIDIPFVKLVTGLTHAAA